MQYSISCIHVLDVASSLLTYFITGSLYIFTQFIRFLPILLLPLAAALTNLFNFFLAILCGMQGS